MTLVLQPPSGVGIVLGNTDNLIIDGITVDAATNGTYAIQFASDCRNVVIRNNKLYAKGDVSSGSYVVIYKASGGVLDNIRIVNNYIDGGYYGIYMYGSSGIANYNTNIYIDSNEITNAYYYATYFYYTSFKSISDNSISTGTTLKSGNFYGIRTYYCDVEKLCNNKIFTRTTMTSNNYGIYSYYLNMSTTGMPNALFANNEIRLDGTSTCSGIYLTYANVDVIHNSIYANSTSTTYGIYSNGSSTSYIQNILNNNIVCTYSSAYPNYITAVAALSGWTMDYNNYYAPSYVGYCAGAQSTLSAWQLATSLDLHSVSVYPAYYDKNISLLLLNDNGIKCPLDSSVMTDIKGQVRDSITTMGAYHYKENRIDVFPSQALSPLSASIAGASTPLTIAVYNLGVNTITSMNIGWEVNGVTQTPYSWSGSLAQHDTVVITIGNFMPQLKDNTLRIHTYAPNSSNDEDVSNDTMTIHTYGCQFILSGTYTVGGASADFASLSEVMEVLQYCGVSAPVVFNFTSGNYESISFLSPIPGASKTNTVTFTSISGNAKDVSIGSGGIALTLTDAENLVFKNLTIGDTVGNTTYAVELRGMCNNIEIKACNIYSSITSTSSTYTAIYANNQNQPKYLKDIRILNNNIRGGYYNMNMLYICGNAAANMISGSVTIDGNTLSDAYYYGIYSNYYGRYYSISDNTITSRSNSGGYYAINTNYYTTIDTMRNNKINIKCSSTAYGIRLYAYQNYSTSYGAQGPMYVANNEIIISTSGSAYGIYSYGNTSYSRFDFLHNSIYVSSTSTAYGIYTYPYSTSYKTVCLNNNVQLNTTSTGYLIFVGNVTYATTSYCTFDYNNYYKPSGTAYYGTTTYTSLSAWQSGLSHDGSSTNTNPLYTNPLLELIPTVNLLCPVLSYVPNDIVGSPRMSTNNNKGCYTVIYNLDAGLTVFVSPSSSMGVGTTNQVSVKLRNYGKTTLSAVTINWQIGGVAQTPVNLSGLSLSRFTDTIINLGTYVPPVSKTMISFKAWTSSPNSGTDNFIYNDSAYSSLYVCDSVLTGTYTVGTGGNYTNINTAIQDITNCGISGPVTFAFLTGTYPSISISGQIPGTSSSNTITFTSATGNASDVVIGSSGIALSLDRTDNLIFKNITIGLTSTVTTYGVDLVGTCENILFYGCNINSYTAATSTSYAPVRYYSSNGSSNCLRNVRFIKNNVDGGYYNFYMYYPAGGTGNLAPSGMSVTIDSNVMTNSYSAGLYSYYYGRYPSLSYNTITSRSSGSVTATWYAMYMYLYHNVDVLVGNKIKSTNASISSPYGIYAYQYYNYTSYSGSGAGLIANNEIILYANGTAYGLYVYYPYSNVQVVHNSVYISGNGNGNAMYTYNPATNFFPIFKNNILATATAGTASYPIYYNSTYYDTRYFNVDYNNYYSTGSNVGYAGSAITTLANLRMATQQDINSLSENPTFISPSVNLHTSGNTMIVSPLTTYDITGLVRPKITNMGCYHDYMPLAVDVKPEAILSPANSKVIPHIQIPIVVELYNMGGDTLTSCDIEWRINNVAQPTYNWTGSLAYLDTVSVQIGVFVFSSGQSIMKINTTLPNHGIDSNVYNDTIATSIFGCDSAFAGIYTVGGPTSDYSSLDEAITMLRECGLSDHVEFQLEAGTYDALYLVGKIQGTASDKTITLSSVTGNPNSVVIRNSSGGVALTLNTTQYLIFKNITIGTTNNTTTYGVQFVGLNQDILFHGCNIYSSTTTTSSAYAAVYFNGPGDPNNTLMNVRFIKNNISGGYYNMYFYRSSGSVSQSVGGNTIIDSNTFSNAYYYGIYTSCIWYFPSISYNTITNRAANSAFTGMYICYYTTVDTLVGNKIHISNTTSTTYGIFVNQYVNTQSWGTRGFMFAANNEVIITGCTSVAYGIYTGTATTDNVKADFLFNSVYISNSSTAYGLYRGYCTATSQISFQNNNVYVSNPTGTVYLLYTYSAYESPSFGIIDYNNYYRVGGTSTYYGTSSYNSLANWKTAYAQDMHSVNVLPVFIDPTQSLELSDYSNLLCVNTLGVLADINGELRSSYTTIGAYTVFIYNGKNVGMLKLLDPINKEAIGCYQDFANVRFVFANRGNVETEFYATPITFKLRVTGASNYQKDTALTFGRMTPTTRDTFTLTNFLPVAVSGTYNISLWLEMSGDGLRSDDTLRSVFIVDKVSIPYAVNFDSVPKGIIISQIAGSATWSVESGDGVSPNISPIHGTGRLQFSSAQDLGSISRLTFQPFNLKGTVMPQFKFWYAHDNANPTKRDYTDVKISIDGGLTYSTILHLQRYNSAYTTPTFVRYEIDLTSYSAYSCVIFALEGGSYVGGNQNIDSLIIISKQDISLALEIPNQSGFVACELDNQSIIAKVSNRTSQLFDFNKYPSQIKVIVSGAVDTVFTMPLSGIINGDTSKSYLISNTFDLSKNGTYNILAYLTAADDNYLNDTIRATRTINVDAAITRLNSVEIKEIGDTVYPTIHIINNGNIPVRNILANVYINNTLEVTESIDNVIYPGDSIIYTFTSPFIVPTATLQQPFYQLRVYIDLPCDGVQANNTVSKYNDIHVPSTVDLSILSINYPIADSCEVGFTKVYPSIDVYNAGTITAEGATLRIVVDSAGIEIETIIDTLGNVKSGETIVFVSTQAYTVPNFQGQYTVILTIEIEGDIDTTNNMSSVVSCAKEYGVSVTDINAMAWNLGQNVPNPATYTSTRIPYTIPQDGQISFNLMSINGQILYKEEVQAGTGTHYLELDIASLSNGIYYYSMEYQGQRIVKKMTIQK